MLEKLKAEKRWFCWKLETRPGQDKPTKVPYSAKSGRKTGTDAKFAGTWTDFSYAKKVCAERGYSGVGFKIPENMFFLDIDHITDDDPRVSRMKGILKTYAEYSQSGRGVHFYGYIDSPRIPVEWNEKEKKNKLASKYYQKHPTNGMELYFGALTNRYAAFTGIALDDSELTDCTDAVLQILEKDMTRKPQKPDQKSFKGTRSLASYEFDPIDCTSIDLPEDVPDEVRQVVSFLCHQRNGAKFAALYFKGDKSGYLNDAGEEDDSRADAALCAMIAFRVGPDKPELIEEVFNYSALCRGKWTSRSDYREATIKAGIRACNGTFYEVSKPMPAFLFKTDSGDIRCNPTLLAEHVRNNVSYIFVRDSGKQGLLILVYDNGVYSIYAPDMFKAVIKFFIEEYDRSLVKMKYVDEAYRQLVTDLNYVKQIDLNADESIINFRNTLIQVTEDQVIPLPHAPQVLSTIQIPCDWTGKDSPTPVFDSYIMRLCNNDTQLVDLVMEIIGICLSNVKGFRMKKAPFFYGDGDTGKSQLKALVERLLGQGNYIGIDLQEIEARFGTGAIYGMRLAGSSDMSFMSVDELKTFKKITGGDSVFAEFKGQQGFEYTYSGMLWFCMNRLPKFGGDDGKWVYDRILPIHCINVIPKEEQDKFLLDKMYAEREGIVYKAVKALQRVITNGYRFSEPQSVERERQRYMSENNTAKAFFDQCMDRIDYPASDSIETVARIYDVYKEWCKDYNSGYSKTMKEFRDTICEHLGTEYADLTVHRKRGTFFRNYALDQDVKEHYWRAFNNGNDGEDNGFLK